MNHVVWCRAGVMAAALVMSGSLAAAAEPLAPPSPSGAQANAAAQGPQELVESSAKKMLSELDAHRDMYRKDPAKLDNLVGTVLLPYFDTEYAARLVLGQNWRTASPDQRKRFVDAFYHSMLRNYGSSLVDFTADRMTVLPFRGDANATSATVRTEVKRDNGSRVPVNYTLHKTDAGWKAWDVSIEGISYVKSFRTDFGAEIAQKGLDSVIQRLERDAKLPGQPAPAKP